MNNDIFFCGDVWIPKGSNVAFPPELSSNLILNLEAAVTEASNRSPSKICLVTDAECFKKAFSVLPMAVCLANNHILDFGKEGFDDTVNFLKKNSVPFFGAGLLSEFCNNPLLIDRGGEVVALLGYVCKTTNPIFAEGAVPGVAPIDLPTIKRDVERSRALGASRIVLCLHWGEEEVSIPQPKDLQMIEAFSEIGVDLVIGHHAHCMHPAFVQGKTKVFFGLGNAAFPDFSYTFPSGAIAWSKQRYWNKRSILVRYNPKSSSTSWKVYSDLSKGKLALGYSVDSKRVLWSSLPGGLDYIKRYKRARRIGHFRLALSRLIAKPRVPSPLKIYRIVKSLAK